MRHLATAGDLLVGFFFVLPLATRPLLRWVVTWDKEIARALDDRGYKA